MIRRLLHITAAVLVLTFTVSMAAAQDETYTDPQERYSVPIPTNWSVEETDIFTRLSSPEDLINVYIMVMPLADGAEQAAEAAWDAVNPDFALEVDDTLQPPSPEGVDSTVVVNYDLGDDPDIIYQAVVMTVGDTAYVILFEGDLAEIQRRATQIGIINSGFEITGMAQDDLTGVEPQPVDETKIAALETYIDELMTQFKVPGAVVAIVQGDEIIYTHAFGVRDLDSGDPMTVDTHMMIGSSGKSLTTTMMATLVDDGLMDWDTPVVEIVPQFAMADPEMTEQITVRNLVCACTGVPRRDLEWLFNADVMTAEDIVESLSTFEVFTEFGEAFQYSNQMVATGGYVAAAAGGAEWGGLFEGYTGLLRERVLEPVGMPDTTLSFEEVEARGEYATPHALGLGFEYIPADLDAERVLIPVGPAGTHWSTAGDMANYIIMQLNNGVAVDGERVVSEANLLVTREPQVAAAADTSYGLGWFVDTYKKLPLIQHGGNTFGFTSDMAFLPGADLGVIVLTNARVSNAFNELVRTRLFDLVFDDVDAEADAQAVEFTLSQYADLFAPPETLLESVDETVVEDYTGSYANDVLGEMVVELVDGRLYADVGEVRSELLPVTEEDDPDVIDYYLLFDPPLSGTPLAFEEDEDGTMTAVIGSGVVEYTFTRVE